MAFRELIAPLRVLGSVSAANKGGKSMEYGFLGWILVGLIAGALAKWIMPGKDPGGVVITILIGIAGGLVGGYVSSMLGIGGGSNIVNIMPGSPSPSRCPRI